MKRTEYFKLIADLFAFKTISDEKGNERVLLSANEYNSIENIEDKTTFEAVEITFTYWTISRRKNLKV